MARGGCLCGAVTFVASGPPKWVAHCHCSMCRRAHGAAFVTWVGMPAERVSIADPAGHFMSYASSPGAEPDLAVVNARVLTSDAALPRAEAFAVKNGRFAAVGSSADIRNLATRRTQVIDAQQMTVTPGVIDCHCHPSGVE